MKAAFIVMSILGCDDSGANCLPVATVGRQWPTITLCDQASEKELGAYQNIHYPMIVAVCQTAETTALADSQADAAELAALGATVPSPPAVAGAPGLTGRAVALVKQVLPNRAKLENAIEKPLHFVTGSYSWVARKISFRAE